MEDALGYFSDGINSEAEAKLKGYTTNIVEVVGSESRYSARRGWKEYRDHYKGKFNDTLPGDLVPAPEDVDVDRSV